MLNHGKHNAMHRVEIRLGNEKGLRKRDNLNTDFTNLMSTNLIQSYNVTEGPELELAFWQGAKDVLDQVLIQRNNTM